MHLQQILRNLDNDLGTLYQKTGLKRKRYLKVIWVCCDRHSSAHEDFHT